MGVGLPRNRETNRHSNTKITNPIPINLFMNIIIYRIKQNSDICVTFIR